MEPERPWSLEAVVAETRAEVRGLRSSVDELRGEVGVLRTEIRRELSDARHEVRSEIAELRSEVRSDIGDLRQDVRRLDDRFYRLLVLQLGTLLAALVSVFGELLR